MLYCKGCGGKLYEESTYVEDGQKMMEIGCYLCYRKVNVPLKKWNKFKKDLGNEITRVKAGKVKEG